MNNTRIRIEGDITFQVICKLLMDIRFKLNEGTHKTFFNLRSGLKKTLLICDTCVVSPLGNFIVDMVVAFGSVITEVLDTI